MLMLVLNRSSRFTNQDGMRLEYCAMREEGHSLRGLIAGE